MAQPRKPIVPHDPLGPTRLTPVGRPVSPLKLHWMAHGTKWLAALGFAALLLIAGLVYWAVRASSEFYAAAPTNTPAPLPPPINRPAAVRDLAVRGPIRLDVEVSKLEEGERVIVLRDTAEILRRRLAERGIEIVTNAPERLTLYYDERRAGAIDVRQATADGKYVSVNSLRPVRIDIKLVLDRPDKPQAVVGEASRTYAGESYDLEITANATQLGTTRRKLYQQSYQAILTYLRQVDLPNQP